MFLPKAAKREKIILTSASIPVLIAFTTLIDMRILSAEVSVLLSLLFIMVVTGLMTIWALDAGTYRKYILPIAFPIYMIVISFYLLINPLRWSLMSLTLLVLFSFVMYILLLALNVLFVSSIKKIPLRQAGFTTLYFLGLVNMLGVAFMSYMQAWGVGYTVMLIWLVAVGFAFSYLYFLSTSFPVWELVIFAISALEIIAAITFWPAPPAISAIAMTGLTFIVLGLIQHHARKDMTANILREYLFIAILLLTVLLLF